MRNYIAESNMQYIFKHKNFRAMFSEYITHKPIQDLTKDDIVYFTNGMYDVGLARFVKYDVKYDRKYGTEYEIDGIVLLSFDERVQSGQLTNMFRYSDTVEVVTEIPPMLLKSAQDENMTINDYITEAMKNDEEIEIPVAKISWWEGRPETLIIIKFIDDDETWYEYDGSRTGLGGSEFPSMDEAIKGFIDNYASEIKDLKFRHGYEQYDSLLDLTRGVAYEL